MNLPFGISPAAERYLRERLASGPVDTEPALVLTTRSETRSPDDRVLDVVNQPHYTIGYYCAGDRPRGSFYDVFGHRVSIMPSTVDSLRGKRLEVSRSTGEFDGRESAREILVATGVTEPPV